MLLIIFSIINSIMLIFAVAEQIQEKTKYKELEARIRALEKDKQNV